MTTAGRSVPVAPHLPPVELRWLEWSARLLDDAFPIPGTRWRFGLDPLLGVLPGVGDAVAAVVSIATLGAALRLGVPRIVLARMGLNVVFDYLLGLVPLIGDVGDVIFKSNRRNLELLRPHALGLRRPTFGDYMVWAASWASSPSRWWPGSLSAYGCCGCWCGGSSDEVRARACWRVLFLGLSACGDRHAPLPPELAASLVSPEVPVLEYPVAEVAAGIQAYTSSGRDSALVLLIPGERE